MAHTEDLLQRSAAQPLCQGPGYERSISDLREIRAPAWRYFFGSRLFHRRRIRKLAFIATDHGMKTAMGMLRYLRETNDQRPVVVLHLSELGEGSSYQRELDRMPRHIKYFRVEQRSGQAWAGPEGCLSRKQMETSCREFWLDAHVFLYGSDQMVEQVRPLLLELGIKKRRICHEFTPGQSGMTERRLKA